MNVLSDLNTPENCICMEKPEPVCEGPSAIGIVAEYNPFHKGHLYQLDRARELSGDKTIIAVMSGDFVQRGEPAAFNKHARAEMACACGVNLVLELPTPRCLSSAEGFARGGVALLSAAGCEGVSFGAESADAELILALARELLQPATRERILSLQKKRPELSFAAARSELLTELNPDYSVLLNRPNNILAVEYAKAALSINPELKLLPVERRGAPHDAPLNSDNRSEYASASSIRELINKGERADSYMPEAAISIINEEIRKGRGPVNLERLELALRSRLLELSRDDFASLPDGAGGASELLYRAVRSNASLEEITEAAVTKSCTRARIKRMLLCAALGISASDAGVEPSYIRVLAADENGRAYLKNNRGRFTLPLITKPASVKELSPACVREFELASRARDLYSLAYTGCGSCAPGSDYRSSPLML